MSALLANGVVDVYCFYCIIICVGQLFYTSFFIVADRRRG